MLKRLILMSGLALAGCTPVPDSGATVSLEPMTPQARSARDAALRGGPVQPATTGATTGIVTASSAPVTPSSLSDDATYTGGPVVETAAVAVPYEVVQPKALPSRPADSGPSVVGYALQTSHPIGTPVYGRANASPERAARACARYASPDLAQAAFLRTGGPQSDSQGVDPDGDGFACGWDPAPFRNAIR